MPSRDPFGRGGAVRGFARSLPPVTGFLLAANVVTFLAAFFSQVPLWTYLGFLPSGAASQPWTLLTYPLVTPYPFLWLMLSLYVFWWVGSDLERRWGSAEFGAFLVSINLVAALSFWVAWLVLGMDMAVVGLGYPLAALFVAWCMLNPDGSVLMMFVLPIRAKILGYVSLGAAYFMTGHPVLGVFALVAPLTAWWYAVKGRVFRRLETLWRHRALAGSAYRERDLPIRPRRPWSKRLNPFAWYERRKRRQEFERLMKISGLAPPKDERDKRSDWDRTVH